MSLLREVGKFNKIPKELLPQLPPAGTVVAFNISQFTLDKGIKRFSEHLTLKPQSAFVHPETNEIIPIALISSTDDKGSVATFFKIVTHPQRNGGCYRLTIGHDENSNDIYRFMMLSSQNGSNTMRMESEDIVYTYHDAIGDAQANSAARKAKREALVFVDKLKDTELNDIALILDIPTGDPDVMRDAIEDYADKDPMGFMVKVNNDDAEITALIKKALKLDVVYRDDVDLRWRKDNSKIFVLSDSNSAVIPQEFVNFTKTRQQGVAIIGIMKELVLTADAKANKPKTGRPAKVAE